MYMIRVSPFAKADNDEMKSARMVINVTYDSVHSISETGFPFHCFILSTMMVYPLPAPMRSMLHWHPQGLHHTPFIALMTPYRTITVGQCTHG